MMPAVLSTYLCGFRHNQIQILFIYQYLAWGISGLILMWIARYFLQILILFNFLKNNNTGGTNA